jgi:Putative beta-barrel porin-2, OmpL-like. bbp2
MFSELILCVAFAVGQTPSVEGGPGATVPVASNYLLIPVAPISIQQQPGSAGPTTPGLAATSANGGCACACPICQESCDGFFRRLMKAYRYEFKPPEKKDEGKADNNGEKKKDDNGEKKDDSKTGSNGQSNGNGQNGNGDEKPEAPRRALPAPMPSPPLPTGEWQGFPLIGVPPSDSVYPLMKALYGECAKDQRTKVYGWANASGNYSTNSVSNVPSSYWIDANHFVLNQFVFRVEREVDSVQTDHIDVGFRSTGLFGTDYRYMTAGGWFSDQLLVHNRLYGADPTEQYVNVYFPGVAQGLIITAGRWIATPDIETQFAPDNYLATHSLLFTVDVYTETGVMATVMLNKQWTVQAAIHAGADMAPWYEGAMPTGMFGVRWVSCDNNDSIYTVLNAINNAEFQYFDNRGIPAGHHNYNIIQTTWQHKFNECVITKTEAYYMWEHNAAVGGTPSIGPFAFNSGGGLGPTIPGTSLTYALLNYTMFRCSDKDFVTVRNEWAKDENGTRFGYAGNYTSNTIGLSHNFNSVFQVRPEIGYYRNWNTPSFDNGNHKGMTLYGLDVTMRF